jgi:CSLREA domain-containing protein
MNKKQTMKYLRKILILLTASLAAVFVSAATASAATYTVDTADDENDGACPVGDCSLREAIAASSAGDTITFDAALDGSTITLGGLGTVSVNKALTIDGDIDGTPGPDITIDGTAVNDNAIAVTGNTVTMDGMIVWGGTTSGHNAIYVSGTSFTLKNSMVNTDGSINKKDASTAIRLSGASASIGTGVSGEGNQIGGTIHINDTSGHSILGNYIGISSAGNDIAPSTDQSSGISITGSSALTITIGGLGSASRNIISNFDSNNGIRIENSGSSTAVTIAGNYIGTNVAGTAAAANQMGIYVSEAVTGAINIGTSSVGNVLSGNSNAGIYLKGGTPTVTLLKNYIGTNATGAGAVANNYGMTVEGCSALTVGDNLNVISGNTTAGILFSNTSCAVSMTGAYIGLGADGSTAIANGTGVSVSSTGGTLAIGTAVGSVNVISGNTGNGISVDSTVTITPTIRNNYIGLSAAGTAAKANGLSGIKLQKPANVYSNIISGNTENGIQLTSTVTTADIQSNYIGLDAAGTTAVPNVQAGIHVFGATGVTIGSLSGANVISGNTQAGILINTSGSATILNNKIGTNAAGTVTTVGNGNSTLSGSTLYYGGILVQAASATIGSGTAGNTIKGNYGQGVAGINTTSLTLKGNTINSNIAGATTGLANGSGVVVIDSVGGSASTIAIGGTGAGEGNTISGNAENGIYVAHQPGGSGISGVTIYANTIGSTGAGNTEHGIFFEDTTPGGNITSVTVGSTSASNTITYNGGAGIYFKFMTTGAIASNTITNNTGVGVWAYASSPTISSNTISSNGSNGVKIESDYGTTKSPSVTADDVRSAPTITGNTVSSNTDVGIYELDSAATNKSTLHTDNTVTGGTSVNGIEQVWYGALAYTCNGTALTSAISSVTVNGSSSAFTTYNGGYWGPTSFNYSDVTTWGQIKEFIYTSSGKSTYSPNTITVTPTSGATSCTVTTGSGTFDGSSYYQTATIALTYSSGSGSPLLTSSSSRSTSRSTTTSTETETEETTREETTTGEEPSREETSTEETTTETTTERPIYTRTETYERYSPTEASTTSTETTRESTTTTSAEIPSESTRAVESTREALGIDFESTISETIERAIETISADTSDADGDGVTNGEELARGTDPYSADSEEFLNTITAIETDPTSLTREEVDNFVFGSRPSIAVVTKDGFLMTGTAAPNKKITVKATMSDGRVVPIEVETDQAGKYIALVDESILGALKEGDLFTVEAGKNQVLAKVADETIKTPEVKFEGAGVEPKETDTEDWRTDLVLNKVPSYIKSTKFADDYLAKYDEAVKKSKSEKIVLKGYTEPNSAVMFVFKSAIFSSVVISDKEGYFEMEVPQELKTELTENNSVESMLHEFIGFSVDYKSNKISPLVKGLFRIYNLKDLSI